MTQFEKLKEEVDSVKAAIFDPIYSIISEAEADATKYYEKGAKSSANRLKKKMQEIRKSINHPSVKTKMTSIQTAAKELRESLIHETKTK